ncbi:MAG: SNF2 helicase associated domain-containing protein [Bacillus sp. (in: firmicutes)]
MKLNRQLIKDRCGSVSFKRGEAFFRADKVSFRQTGTDRYSAIVTAAEDFHVAIEAREDGDILTTCSCPSLASFQKDCQHVAAVLLAIHEQSRHWPSVVHDIDEMDLAADVMGIFSRQPVRTSEQQRHFDERQPLICRYYLVPSDPASGQDLLGIGLKIGSIPVEDLKGFLTAVRQQRPHKTSPLFIYDPSVHCFTDDDDAILHILMEHMGDEQGQSGKQASVQPIMPGSWTKLLPFFNGSAQFEWVTEKGNVQQLNLTEEPLPLSFSFTDGEVAGDYHLEMHGLEKVVLLADYRCVLSGTRLFGLTDEDAKRLQELFSILNATRTNRIPVKRQQLGLFLEKVVPGLKRLGKVYIPEKITAGLSGKPLIAKLYLDRIKNRLLAGIEFHYGDIVINPFEPEPDVKALLIREEEKEDMLLELMDNSGFAKTEGGFYLQNEELEYHFLHHVVPKIQPLAQIFATTAIRNRIFRGNARPIIKIRLKRERTNWLEFKFTMDGIPDHEIRDVLHSLEEKRKFHRLKNGSLLSLEGREYDEIRRFLNEVPDQKQTSGGVWELPLTKGLPYMSAEGENNIFAAEESFRQFLELITQPNKNGLPVPPSLDPVMRDYQKHGYRWLKTLAAHHFGGILADDMGLGKTLQSIAYLVSNIPEIRDSGKPALIVCPSSLTYNWLNELVSFAPEIEAIIADGSKKERMELLSQAGKMDVIITSYPLLRMDLDWYSKQSFHTVFFDEAQAFKNPVTQTAKAVKRITASHKFALTGTPIENSPEELWSIFHVVFPELFLGLRDFSHLDRQTIARRSRPFLLRRMKEDVLAELPAKQESIDFIDLLPEQKKLYTAYLAKLRHDTLKHLDKETFRKNKIRILAGLTRLRQICCHPGLFVEGYDGTSAKFEHLKKLMKEALLSGRRVLIFSQFTKMLELVKRELAAQGVPYFYLDGQTPSEERVDLCSRFNNGESPFFLISLKAGGTGLNLTGADTVILYDLWWNPAVEEQAMDRAHRIGQNSTVQVIKLVTKGTIEEKMNELHDKKRMLIEEIIDSESASLSEDDIRDLLNI